LLIVCCLVGMLFVTRIFAVALVKRIEYLNERMRLVGEGDLSIRISSPSKDEIGELINRFNSMLINLNQLIDEVYRSDITRREAEMKALRAQINPHFLYNTLGLVNIGSDIGRGG